MCFRCCENQVTPEPEIQYVHNVQHDRHHIEMKFNNAVQVRYKKLHISLRSTSTFKSCQRSRDGIISAISSLNSSMASWFLSLYSWTFGGSLTCGSLGVIGVSVSCNRIKLWRVQHATITIIWHCCSNLICGILSAKILHLLFNISKVLSTVIHSDECRWLKRSLTLFGGPNFLNC